MAHENWSAARDAMFDRMAEKGLSVAELAALTGQSETTIRSFGKTERDDKTAGADKIKRANKSTLALISVMLDWKHDHLWNIAQGEPEKNSGSTMEIAYARTLRQMKEYNSLKSAIAALHDSLHEVEEEITRLMTAQDDAEGDAQDAPESGTEADAQ
jgi:hypothetical protein